MCHHLSTSNETTPNKVGPTRFTHPGEKMPSHVPFKREVVVGGERVRI